MGILISQNSIGHLLRPLELQRMLRLLALFSFLLTIVFNAPSSAMAVTIDTVFVGDAGNPSDPSTGNRYGSVAYNYRIGTTEVTNAQYAEFLNAKAKSDPLALYSTNMGNVNPDARGGIARSGVSGNYSYSVIQDMGNKPVNYVTWYDAIRFCNWLNNGQGDGDTETGAYTILGGTETPNLGITIVRNSNATWFLPSKNEWYKAAYYQPAARGGDVDNYWAYPTASNSPPTPATANSVGDISNPGSNVANFDKAANWSGFLTGDPTSVGSAGPLSKSFYGTSDQGGNVMEWDETRIIASAFRGIDGGSWFDESADMRSDFQVGGTPSTERINGGFRVASVPEPSTAFLALTACGLLIRLRKRFK